MAARILLDDLIDGIKERKEVPGRDRVVKSLSFAARFLGQLAARSPTLAPLHAALQALLGTTSVEDSTCINAMQSKLTQLKARLARTRSAAEKQKLAAQIKLLGELFEQN